MKRSLLLALMASLMVMGCSDDTETTHEGGDGENTCTGDDCDNGGDDNGGGDNGGGDNGGGDNGDKDEVTCGNGVLDAGEACDEGKAQTAGCSSDCKTITSGWACTTAGQACTKENLCGNGVLDAGEACDEGSTYKTEGCSDDCTAVHEGWHCDEAGMACHPDTCGNGVLDPGEECDEGEDNETWEYGMFNTCQPNCVKTPYCGDGRTDAGYEVCDNGDQNVIGGSDEDLNGYGLCLTSCTLSTYACGNGKISHEERCDDGNTQDGDGCSSTCMTEPGYFCATPGAPCEKFKCGNGVLDEGETCDDANRRNDDGCSSVCQTEPGYICTTAGQACELITCASPSGTTCHDGNEVSGDGCSSVCQIEPGWICPDGEHCYVAGCGDGHAVGTEDCDDGNAVPGDGCSEYCMTEEGYVCPEAGGACHKTVCGDGIKEGDETCDEGTIAHPENQTVGCIDCNLQMGWQCLTDGTSCTNDASCGNGILEGAEECDEGANATGGCTGCIVTPGWRCPTPGNACIQGVCGDGQLDKGEFCDDGNLVAGDGCDPTCKHENIFICPKVGECKPVCGDGITMWMLNETVREECDDGNTVSGDGCSADCKIESGWTCTDFTDSTPDYIEVPVNYYDFWNWQHTGTGDGYLTQEFVNKLNAMDSECYGKAVAGRGFPDFQRYGGSGCDGMVYNELDADGKPVLRRPMGNCTNIPSTPVSTHLSCAGTYHYWYRYEPGVNRLVKSHLMLFAKDKSTGMYRFDSAAPCSDFACGAGATWAKTATGEPMPQGNYVPINKAGYCDTGTCDQYDIGGFTTEIKTYFQYKGGETLEFQGNDDVWVFLNNKLFVDLGGMQGSRTKSATLKADKFGETGRNYDPDFEVYEGGVYSVKLFNAERMMTGSSFRLTLSGFVNAGEATCASTCGDGIVVGSEQCDEGTNNGQPGASCAINCMKIGCGNGIVESGEACDDGNDVNDDSCSNACKKPSCGDGITQSWRGEVCDDGINDGAYGHCGLNCAYRAPHCGDGMLQADEGEACDLGDLNTGAYGLCSPHCELVARCGDGIIQPQYESCDDGEENGQEGKCPIGCSDIIL